MKLSSAAPLCQSHQRKWCPCFLRTSGFLGSSFTHSARRFVDVPSDPGNSRPFEDFLRQCSKTTDTAIMGSAPTTLSQDIRGRGPSVSGVFVPSQRDRSDVRHNDLLRGFSGPAGTHCRRERKCQGGEEPKNEQIRHAPRQ
ncbi:unnamed protein product [Boreogadus saida]